MTRVSSPSFESSTQSPEALERIGRRRCPVAQHLGEVFVPDGDTARGEERFDVDVVLEVRPRDGNVAGVSSDADVGDRRFVRQPVERRMGLDEPTMLLGFEVADHGADVTGLHVEARRDEVERSVERRALEDQQRADHLHPGRAGLPGSADDDVARPRREPLPTVAVQHRRPIPSPRGPRHARIMPLPDASRHERLVTRTESRRERAYVPDTPGITRV